jgi:hypothetical protein
MGCEKGEFERGVRGHLAIESMHWHLEEIFTKLQYWRRIYRKDISSMKKRR